MPGGAPGAERRSPSPQWGEGARRAGEGGNNSRSNAKRPGATNAKRPGATNAKRPGATNAKRPEATIFAPSPRPSPRWGEVDHLAIARSFAKRRDPSFPSPRWGEGARRAGEGGTNSRSNANRPGATIFAPSPHPSPRWGEVDHLAIARSFAKRQIPRSPRPGGERVPEGRVRGEPTRDRMRTDPERRFSPPHPIPLPVGARATTWRQRETWRRAPAMRETVAVRTCRGGELVLRALRIPVNSVRIDRIGRPNVERNGCSYRLAAPPSADGQSVQ